MEERSRTAKLINSAVWFDESVTSDLDQFLLPQPRPVRMVLDTDAFNEIDDQFAIAYALSVSNLEVEAIYAAPFLNERSVSAGDGMLKSYDEILAVLDALDGKRPPVFAGSTRFMDAGHPEESAAARDLIERATASSPADPLYVVTIGAPTNVAAALLIEPGIAANIRIVWLGGHSFDWPVNDEFNLHQDLASSRLIVGTDARLLLLPCAGVASHLTLSLAELESALDLDRPIVRLLHDRLRDAVSAQPVQARVLWDVGAVAALRNPDWVPSRIVPSPGLADDLSWQVSESGSTIRAAYFVHRNPIIADLLAALGAAPAGPSRDQ